MGIAHPRYFYLRNGENARRLRGCLQHLRLNSLD